MPVLQHKRMCSSYMLVAAHNKKKLCTYVNILPVTGEQLLEALAVYKREHGNVAVPVRFIVPEGAGYPEDVWGMPLGMRVAKVYTYIHTYIYT
jgi:hypothetical protein